MINKIKEHVIRTYKYCRRDNSRTEPIDHIFATKKEAMAFQKSLRKYSEYYVRERIVNK